MPIQPGSQDRDFAQVLKEVYDPATNRLMVESIVTDGTDALLVNADGSINVNVSGGGSLPAGAATSANQTTEISKLTTINTTLGSPMQTTGGTVTANAGTGTFAVSASTLPLPTGAATAANQATEIATLTAIGNNLPPLGGYSTSGTINGGGQIVCTMPTYGLNSAGIVASGTWTGLIAVQGTVDGVWELISVYDSGSRTTQLYISTPDIATVVVGGYSQIRLIAVSAITGTANCTVNINSGISALPVTSVLAGQFYATANLRDNNSNGITSTGGALDVNLKTSSITVPVSAASLPLPTGAATDTNQATQITELTSIANNTPTLGGYTATGSIAASSATACTINTNGMGTMGIIAIGSWSGLIEVQGTINGTDWLLIPIFDFASRSAQLFISTPYNATAIVGGFSQVRLLGVSWVSGTANCTVVLNEGLSQLPVTSVSPGQFYVTANLRDNASNSITSTGGALDVNLKSEGITLPVSQSSTPWISTPVDVTNSGTLTSTGSVAVALDPGNTTWTMQFSAFSTSSTVLFEYSQDTGTTWWPMMGYQITSGTPSSGSLSMVGNAGAGKIYIGSCSGYSNIRARCSTYNGGDTIVINIRATCSYIGGFSPTPAGIASIGTVGLNAGSNSVGTVGLNAGANNIGTVNPPTLTKGTQGSIGITTQDLKDSGRVPKVFYATAAAAGTTTVETLLTLTFSSDTSATTTGTSFTPTSGKTFRIQSMMFACRGNTTATAEFTDFNIRVNTAGAVTTSSTPVVMSYRIPTPATANVYQPLIISIPDGYEFYGDGTKQWGITTNSTFTTNAPTLDVMIIGYEY